MFVNIIELPGQAYYIIAWMCVAKDSQSGEEFQICLRLQLASRSPAPRAMGQKEIRLPTHPGNDSQRN